MHITKKKKFWEKRGGGGGWEGECYSKPFGTVTSQSSNCLHVL